MILRILSSWTWQSVTPDISFIYLERDSITFYPMDYFSVEVEEEVPAEISK